MLFILLISVAFAWYAQSFLFQKCWSKHLTVKLNFQDSYIYEGESSSLRETVINDKLLPLPALCIRFAMSRHLVFRNEAIQNSNISDQTYRNDVFSLLFHQQITRNLPFVAKHRGYYSITETTLTATDYFYSIDQLKTINQDTGIYIFPAQINTNCLNIICRTISGMILTQNRLHPDPFEFSGIREYRREDPMNRINWKASARTGNLMVNQHDATTNIDLKILFDLEDKYIIKYPELLEETIRIVSSLAARLLSVKMPVTIIGNINHPITKTSFYEYLPAGGGKMMELNQKLAQIDVQQLAFSAVELLENETQHTSGNYTYVFVSKNQQPEIIEQLRHLISYGNQILWILPVTCHDENIHYNIPSLQLFQWEVTE